MNTTERTHPSHESLAGFNSGKLGALESAEIERHLAECEDCCRLLMTLPNDTLVSLLKPGEADTTTESGPLVRGGSGQLPTGAVDPKAGNAEAGSFRHEDPMNPPLGSESPTLAPAGEITYSAAKDGELAPGGIPDELKNHPRYRIVSLLGRGGMGSVYEAEHRLMNRPVALKVIDPQLVQTPGLVERFQREVQAAARLSHPNIVAAHDAEQAAELHFLVMELVRGHDLSQVLAERGKLPLSEACNYVRQAALGLQHAHERDMVHRDIKPQNLMLTADGHVKILDFGLAQFASEIAEESGLTQVGAMMGTPDYMAPEQARDAHSADIRADIYSLGCTLYCLLSGRAPFPQGSILEKVLGHMEREPAPLQELRDDVPAELAAVLRKMMSKKPADRYQTPAEVAQALAPFLLPLPLGEGRGEGVAPVIRPSTASTRPPRSRRVRVATAALGALALVTALGVISIVTDKGRIEIQSDVDDVEVVVKRGDQVEILDVTTGSKINWFPSGKYEVELKGDRNDIEIGNGGFKLTRWGKAVVTLTRKPGVADPANIGATSLGPFVVLDGTGKLAKEFSNLAEAVAWAVKGDTIEIRGDGPFVMRPIDIKGKALTIRAGANCQPVVRLDPEGVKANEDLLTTDAPLVLEGIELQRTGSSEPMEDRYAKLVAAAHNLTIVNCRLLQTERLEFNAIACGGPVCEIHNSIVLTTGTGLSRVAGPAGSTVVENCVFACGGGMSVWGGSTQVSRSTILANYPFAFFHWHEIPDIEKQRGAAPSMRWRSTENVLHANHFLLCYDFVQEPSPDRKQALLRGFMGWEEQGNVYQAEAPFLNIDYAEKPSIAGLSDWEQFWGLKNSGATQSRIRYDGGDIVSRLKTSPETVVPADFRLHADSAGKGAGPGGRDIGADVDFVGPGAGYERWKQTPEYAAWLKESAEQMPSAAADVEPFIVLDSKDKKEYKFPTLAEAVTAALNGDTIEIRGNGPFVTRPIVIQGKALAIRAGTDYHPVLQLDPEGVKTNANFLTTDAQLVLEGLELQRLGKGAPAAGHNPCLVHGANNLSIANCRFLQPQRLDYVAISCGGENCEVRNCIILETGTCLVRNVGPARTTSVENCVFAGSFRGMGLFEFQDRIPSGSHHAARNTILAGSPFGFSQSGAIPDLDEQAPGASSIRWRSSKNVLDAKTFALAIEFPGERPAEEEVALLRRFMAWEEQSNIYQAEVPLLGITWAAASSIAGLRDWEQFWGLTNSGSVQGRIRYVGGDVWSRLATSPETLVPADFRLHADSAGKRAGRGGRDIGADVDLVGPGPAYERWKKTPEYQQWLKTTGQNGRSQDTPPAANAPFSADQAKQHQAAWARHLGVPVEYTNSIGMKFVLIPPGEFTMGSTPGEIEEALRDVAEDEHWQECIKSEAPQHKVILTQPIYLGVNEVTQAEYEKVMGTNPSHFAPMGMGKEAVAGIETTDHPVETVSWNDAAEFCAKLSQREKLDPFYFRAGETITPLNGTGYRLPSEAEWEFACRAGTATKHWIGDKDEDLVRAGWFGGNSGSQTHAVGKLKGNPFGLFDIHGNVWEWVQDGWDATCYRQFQEKPTINPSTPFSAGSRHLIRGGPWSDSASSCRSSHRYASHLTLRLYHIGFRASLPVDAVKAAITAEKATSGKETTSWKGWPKDTPPPAIAPFNAEQAKQHQESWAKHLAVPVEYTNSIGMKFRLIPPGEFTMGSTPAEIEAAVAAAGDDPTWQMQIPSEGPQHKVILTRPYYLGVHEVTQSQYQRVVGRNPSHFAASGPGKEAVAGLDTSNYPVEELDWSWALEFCIKLSMQEELTPIYFATDSSIAILEGTGYRLPTEAEWEFACRAGTTTKFWIGDKDEALPAAGWYGLNGGLRPHNVGELQANPFGLYDIHGNVWEWVQDAWEPAYFGQFQETPAVDPMGPPLNGPTGILRGGNWSRISSYCRASGRYPAGRIFRDWGNGMRVSLTLEAVQAAEKAKTGGAPARPEPVESFVILAKDGIAERKFTTYLEAVRAMQYRDILEIRGDGPFVVPPVDLGSNVLTIRAGQGFRPVLSLDPKDLKSPDAMLTSHSPFTLEGVELQRLNTPEDGLATGPLVKAQGSIRIANCRLVHTGVASDVLMFASPPQPASSEIVNSQIVGGWACIGVWPAPKHEFSLSASNCLFVGPGGIGVNTKFSLANCSLMLSNNTFAASLAIGMGFWGEGDWLKANMGPARISFDASGNVWACRTLQAMNWLDETGVQNNEQAKVTFKNLIDWKEANNLFSDETYLVNEKRTGNENILETYDDWRNFWNLASPQARQGEPAFEGVIVEELLNDPVKLARTLPPAFKLAGGGPGKGAGSNGNDLGADVDLVGPGPAYERWKKTPEYLEWLKQTGRNASKAEPAESFALAKEGSSRRPRDSSAVTPANYQKLKRDMTLNEVEAILGPGGSQPPTGLPWSDFTPGGVAPRKAHYYWWTESSLVVVGFIDGKLDLPSTVMHH